jgi:predicted Ser/Thr protein kinase
MGYLIGTGDYKLAAAGIDQPGALGLKIPPFYFTVICIFRKMHQNREKLEKLSRAAIAKSTPLTPRVVLSH